MSRLLRLPALLAFCLLAALPSGAAAAAKVTYPSISKVAPLTLGVGDTLTLRGKNFRAGTGRNTVVFKRSGGRAVFVKAGKATRTSISVKVPPKLLPVLSQKSGKPVATRFQLRVLAGRFGRVYTTVKASPLIGPKATNKAVAPDDCDGDLTPNFKDADDDNDLLSDTLEATLKTDACKRDSDGDGMTDGWEHESALDYNGRAKPAPLRRPYPNALDAKDGAIDSDGDGLTNVLEYAAWATFGGSRLPLSYSGGDPASAGRQPPAIGREWHNRDTNSFLSDNERDADGDGISNQDEGGLDPLPVQLNVVGFFSDVYIEGVSNIINTVPLYGPLPYVKKVLGTSWLDADSDGDTITDGVDDQDGDSLTNLDEILTELSAGDKLQRPLNPCAPNLDARLCIVGDDDTDNDGQSNRDDKDDDDDRLLDDEEKDLKLNPFKADTDGDGVSDGYEYQSAVDLNAFNSSEVAPVPYPGKRPYPNPLDGTDGQADFDGDGLTLTDEYRAWIRTERPAVLNYSDGTLYTGGRGAPVDASNAAADTDRSGFLSDDEKDVDDDGLTNWDEAHGRMTPKWWELEYAKEPKESVYPTRTFAGTDFVVRDTDADGIRDGDDDEDHDGFRNSREVERPFDWRTTYVSTTKAGTNRAARVNPFNPCKPYYSDTCHRRAPFDYYGETEDWESPDRQNGPDATP